MSLFKSALLNATHLHILIHSKLFLNIFDSKPLRSHLKKSILGKEYLSTIVFIDMLST